jgi:MYXO-CTERM domain-containing protein
MRTWMDRGLLIALGCAACTGDQPAWDAERLGESDEAIVNGSLDTTHQAVVAWLHGSKCSATIVHVSGSTGYALTAAHCVGGPLGEIRQGNNHNSQYIAYPVTNATIHPEYNASNAYDFAMLTFSGATAATPALPVLSLAQDNINNGTVQELLGYGLTENGGTSLRHTIDRPVAFNSPLWLGWNQQTGGVCSGDSGGPALHSIAGQEYVSAVHSFVSNANCNGFGVSVRASAVRDTFIQPYIDGTPFQPQTCGQCFDAHTKQGACADEVDDCFANPSCEAYVDCLGTCFTQSCVHQCAVTHSSGKSLFDDIYACACDGACSAECSGDPICEPTPACFVEATDPSCNGCLESACCDEATVCATDSFCLDCVTSSSPNPNCENNAKLIALSSCLETSCGADCAITSSGAGGGGGSEPGVGGGALVGAGGGPGGGNPIDNGDDEGPIVIENGCACRAAPSAPSHAGWLALLGLVRAGPPAGWASAVGAGLVGRLRASQGSREPCASTRFPKFVAAWSPKLPLPVGGRAGEGGGADAPIIVGAVRRSPLPASPLRGEEVLRTVGSRTPAMRLRTSGIVN